MSTSIDQILRSLGLSTTGAPPRRKRFASIRPAFVRRKRRFTKKWTWDIAPFNNMKENNVNGNTFLGLSDFTDMITTDLKKAMVMKEGNVVVSGFSILATDHQWLQYLSNIKSARIIQVTTTRGIVVFPTSGAYIDYTISANDVEVDIHGMEGDVDNISSHITERFERVLSEVEWVYGGDGQSIDVPIRADRHPVNEMYPFLNGQTLEEYYDRYMESSASILLLIGPPGTGKTSFIRGLMQHTQSSAIVTYDEGLMARDHVFASFIEGDKRFMVIEDADMFLKARSEGNTTMHKFLNVGDGLVTTRNKKMIFSTNLPSTRDIDPALLRPGRCFDIVTFDLLTQEQAEKLATRVNVTLTDTRDRWSIADVFNKAPSPAPTLKQRNPFGFV